ncbi:hypothetical protein SE904_03090, partial [Enterococcus faecium]|nr:hypothetical protein [Enterococcus faecium]
MFSDKEVLLKSLHVCLKLPIVVFNSEFSIIKEYRSDRTTYFFYDYKKLLTDNIKKTKDFHFFTGDFNEMFLLYMFKTRYYLFGPFRESSPQSCVKVQPHQKHNVLRCEPNCHAFLSEERGQEQ